MYIGRGCRAHKASKWANPFRIRGPNCTREWSITTYIEWFNWPEKQHLRDALSELIGKVLGCHCKELACHGDYLASRANQLAAKKESEADDD